ncbi:heat shock protein HspQ [Sphingopyxis sp. MWB1]|uniref:heat shock protein HspQ n=1 Tax=Sphingopyxis sp. MWB1 TaxID=1537715 RepID=UPI00068C07B0|nr:heat shock protein HspQ [Sphingopyxis sp. MWB1]
MTNSFPLAVGKTTNGIAGAPLVECARFAPGDIVRHRLFEFRGVVFDIDPVFANSEEWYAAIPEEMRPAKEQPFYHLLAENEDSSYIAYVSQQNLVGDADGGPVDHPQIDALFDGLDKGRYRVKPLHRH